MANAWDGVVIVVGFVASVVAYVDFVDNLMHLLPKITMVLMEASRTFDLEKDTLLKLENRLQTPTGLAMCAAKDELADIKRIISRDSFLSRVLFREIVNSRLQAVGVDIDLSGKESQKVVAEADRAAQQVALAVSEVAAANHHKKVMARASSDTMDEPQG